MASLWLSSYFCPAKQTQFSALCGKLGTFKDARLKFLFSLCPIPYVFIIYNQKERPTGTMTRFALLLALIIMFYLSLIRWNTLLLAFLLIWLLASFLSSLLSYLLINSINEEMLLKVDWKFLQKHVKKIVPILSRVTPYYGLRKKLIERGRKLNHTHLQVGVTTEL